MCGDENGGGDNKNNGDGKKNECGMGTIMNKT